MVNPSSKHVYRVNFYEVATMLTAAPVNGTTATHLPVMGTPRFAPKETPSGRQVANFIGASGDEPNQAKPIQDFGFTVPWFTGTADFGPGAAAAPYLASLLESYWGGAGVDGGAGTTIGAASGPGLTTDLVVASTTGILAGHAIMVNGEVAFVVKNVDATHLTLNRDFTTAGSLTGSLPALADVVYVGMNYRVTLGQRTKVNYINIENMGYAHLVGHGALMSLKFAMKDGGELAADCNFQGDTYAAGLTPTTFTPNAFTGPALQAKGGQVVIANTAEVIASGAIDPNLQKEWRKAASGGANSGAPNGRDGVVTTGQLSPTFTFSEFYNSTRESRYSDKAIFDAMIAFTTGSTAAARGKGALAMWLPAAQVTSFAPADIDNSDGQNVTVIGRNPVTSPNAVVVAQTAIAANGAGIHACHFTVFGGI